MLYVRRIWKWRGGGNNGFVIELAGRKILVAERKGTWLAMGATVPFMRASCGYVSGAG